MALLSRTSLTTLSNICLPQVRRSVKLSSFSYGFCNFPNVHTNQSAVCCTKLAPWESSPVTYAPSETDGEKFVEKATNIFDRLNSEDIAEAPETETEELAGANNGPFVQLQLLKLPMWVLGPSLLLVTGMVPSLWLPVSSIFLGPNMVSLLSLIGLDCIFNLGATLFLLMADSCARPKHSKALSISKPPFSYQFWNMFAAVTGFAIPLIMLFASHKGLVQTQLPFISFAVLLAPYFLLLSVQTLTEMLTWHWQSPVWLAIPIVYEAYRVLQLMRGLKLAAELSAPNWVVHTIRGLVCWWVLILGIQLMRVAWFSGFTAQARRQISSTSPHGL